MTDPAPQLTKGDPRRGLPGPPAAAAEGGLLGLLLLDAILLAGLGLAFTPYYVGAVPVPVGALLVVAVLPWLVRRAGDVDPRPGVAGAPLWVWLLVTLALGLWGPGGDAMLPMAPDTAWTSLVLVGGGLLAGLLGLRLRRPGPPGQDGGTR